MTKKTKNLAGCVYNKTAPISAAEYKSYLERFNKILQYELVPKMAFLKAVDDYETASPINPMLSPVCAALLCDITITLAKLFDNAKGSYSIYKFISDTKAIYPHIAAKTPFTLKMLADEEIMLAEDGLCHIILRLRKRRNLYFAHYDPAFFLKPSKLDEVATDDHHPLLVSDILKLLNTLLEIIGEHSLCFFGHFPICLPEVYEIHAFNLLEKLHKPPESLHS